MEIRALWQGLWYIVYLFIYLFIYYERSYNTYIVQEESANKVIKKLRRRKMRNQVTHNRRMQTGYHQKN